MLSALVADNALWRIKNYSARYLLYESCSWKLHVHETKKIAQKLKSVIASMLVQLPLCSKMPPVGLVHACEIRKPEKNKNSVFRTDQKQPVSMTNLDVTRTWSPRLAVNLSHREVRVAEKVPPVLRVLSASCFAASEASRARSHLFLSTFYGFQKSSLGDTLSMKQKISQKFKPVIFTMLVQLLLGSKMPLVSEFQACEP